jgi:5-oxoprolinase (ATP-hydrolysing) subunit A
VSRAIDKLGETAFRLVRPSGVSARALFEGLRREPGVIDVVITEGHVGLTFDPDAPPRDPSLILAELASAKETLLPPPARVQIAVRYDGVDLQEIAEAAQLSIDEVIALHTARTYVVKMVGFLPGFAYLGDVEPRIAAPRRAKPRQKIPAGSVAIGGPYTAVYPFASPGGWNIIGAALDFSPFALALGDEVRFERT